MQRYTTQDVEPDAVRALLRAAVQAPGTQNQLPRVFAVFHGRKRLADYSVRTFLIRTYLTAFEGHPRSMLYERPATTSFTARIR